MLTKQLKEKKLGTVYTKMKIYINMVKHFKIVSVMCKVLISPRTCDMLLWFRHIVVDLQKYLNS